MKREAESGERRGPSPLSRFADDQGDDDVVPSPAAREAPTTDLKTKQNPPTPAPLTLVAAEYEDASTLTLTFDRAVDVSAAIVDFLAVKDGTINERLYLGAGTPLVISPTTFRVELIDVDPFAGAGITLTADAGNGIVAADDGAEWSGVTDLALPFG